MPGPSGKRLVDGFPTTIGFSLAATIQLWEKEVTPPGVDAGGANDTSTMRNLVWRTRGPKALKTLTDCSGTAGYDPAVYPTLTTTVGKNQLITITFPNLATLAFWGWLDKATPQSHKDGDMPLMGYTIVPSNQDTTGAEVAPVFTAPPP